MQQRRSVKIFDEVFQTLPADIERKKGRSAQLHNRRNECLIDRYYYYGKFTDKRYLDILDDLSREFFLSPVTIPDLIADNISMLTKLKAQQPSKSYFSKKWNHLMW